MDQIKLARFDLTDKGKGKNKLKSCTNKCAVKHPNQVEVGTTLCF